MKRTRRWLAVGLFLAAMNGEAAFIADPFDGYAGLESGAAWDVFNPPIVPDGEGGFVPDFNGPYLPDLGTTPAGNEADFSILQTNPAAGSFVTSGGNLYSAGGAPVFQLQSGYTTGYDLVTNPIRSVVFQVRTQGTELDYGSILLTYNGGLSLTPAFTSELSRVALGGFGGDLVEYAVQFDLSDETLTQLDFGIAFEATGAHLSLDAVQLDFSSVDLGAASVVPEPSTWSFLAAAMLIGGFWYYRRLRRQTGGLS